jgi:hypothetical protein
VLCSNSSWIASDVPSITYGLRGVVHCNIEVRSHIPVHIPPLIHSPILRSHHEPLKTAIPVLTEVDGTSLCGTCERFSPAKCRFVNIYFNRIQVLAGLTDRNRNVIIPNFCANLTSFLSLRKVTYRSLIDAVPASQTTKCDQSTKKKRGSSAC